MTAYVGKLVLVFFDGVVAKNGIAKKKTAL